jgi:hypothetical protein
MDLTSLEFTGGVYAGATYSETMIVTTVPMGAMTGPITVNSSYGSTMSSTFTITP